MQIRDVVVADAPAACDALRRSIAELCGADHKGDPAILERWLANKTPGIVASWMTQPGNLRWTPFVRQPEPLLKV